MKRVKDAFTGSMFRRLFLPMVCSGVGLALSDMADAIVVGRRMGETGLAAVGMSLPLYMVLNVIMHGFGTGGSAHYAKLLGEGRAEEAVSSFNRVLRTAMVFSVAIAALVNLFPAQVLRLMGVTSGDGMLYEATKTYVRIIALGAPLFFLNYILNDYLRNDDSARLAGAGFLAGNIVDILLNIVFVVGLNLGTAGAAWATLIGLTVSVLSYLPALVSKRHMLKIRAGRLALPWRHALAMFRSGFSTSSQYLWQMIFLLLANRTLMLHLGGQGVAVFDVIQNASYLVMYLYDAAAKALQPLASTFHGERNRAAARCARRIALLSGLAVGFVALGAMAAFPQGVCDVFGLTEPDTRAIAVRALRLYCAGACFAGVSVILESYYQAVNAERCAFVIALLRGCLVLIPVTLALGVFAPQAFWCVFPVVEITSLAVFGLWKRLHGTPEGALDDGRVYACAIRSHTGDMGGMMREIDAFCDRFDASPRQRYFVTMAAEEITLAIIEGGFKDRDDGLIQLTLIAREDGLFELHIRDNAVSFDPFSLHTTRVGEEDFDAKAMGILVVKQRARDFFYRRYQGFNTLVVRI